MKVKVFVKDGHRVEEYKGKYDPDDQIIEIIKKTGLLTREPERFQVNPNHIYHEIKRGKIKSFIYVNRRTRKSVPIGKENDPPEVDQETRNKLDFLVDKAMWKALIEKVKISTFTALIFMFAGYGILRFLEWMIFYIMQAK